MNQTHLVSVGLPVYNGERFLSRALDSLLAQSYGNFELIISDNASTDSTEQICRSYASRDPRIRYVRNPENMGAAWNFNRLPQLARGDYFKWAMSDDMCTPELIGRCVEVLDSTERAVLACARTVFIDENDNIVSHLDPGWDLRNVAPHERLMRVIFAGGHGANSDALAGVIRRDALLRTRLVPRYQGGDKRPLAELSLMGDFIEIPEYLYFRRIHPSASSANNPEYARNKREAIRWMVEFFKGSTSEVLRPTWRLLFDHASIVGASGLGLQQKLGLYLAILKSAYWNRRGLWNEISQTAVFRLGSR